MELKPDDIEMRNALAAIYLRLGRLGEAEDQWRNVLKLQIRNAAALKGLGMVLVATGRGPQAVGVLQHALELEPRNAADDVPLAQACLAARQ